MDMTKLKRCGVCLKDFNSLWKAKTREKPAMCRTCAMIDATQIGNYKLSTKSVSSDIKPVEKRTPIKPISTKQAKINADYKVLNKAFMERNEYCVARFEGICTHKATELHHIIFGSNKRKHYLDETTFRAVCSQCHRHIHDKMDSDELVKLGLRILD